MKSFSNRCFIEILKADVLTHKHSIQRTWSYAAINLQELHTGSTIQQPPHLNAAGLSVWDIELLYWPTVCGVNGNLGQRELNNGTMSINWRISADLQSKLFLPLDRDCWRDVFQESVCSDGIKYTVTCQVYPSLRGWMSAACRICINSQHLD